MGKAGLCRMRSRFRRRVFDDFSTGDFSPRATEDRQCGKICQWLCVGKGAKKKSSGTAESGFQTARQGFTLRAAARHPGQFLMPGRAVKRRAKRKGGILADHFTDLKMFARPRGQLGLVGDQQHLALFGQGIELFRQLVQGQAAHTGVHLIKDICGAFRIPAHAGEGQQKA